ncbi:MAG: hypothetical protein M3Z15_13415 [Pseudomonadota bacterium]|nr:hypothetical protein [Pseudomonadota bacterium]
MKAFDTSSLWRISEFRKARNEGRLDLAQGRDHPTLLPTTLLADLRRLQSEGADGDVVEVIAACVRNHEAALLYLVQGAFVWPVTLFPREGLYHSPRDALAMAASSELSGLRLLSAEPPGVRAPGNAMHERVASPERYRRLAGLLWAVALHGPRPALLAEISGRVAYRLVSSHANELPPSKGAIGSTVSRLERQSASLGEIARWPGMSVERASRLLNALYLCGALMITRSHPAARNAPVSWLGLFSRRK